MNWYTGSIAEAIVRARSTSAIFVVFLDSGDEPSKIFTSQLNDEVVLSVLNSNQFVAIKIAANSQSHQQFAQIYPNAAAPSLYFIGLKGEVLDVVTTVSNKPQLLEKLKEVYLKAGLTKGLDLDLCKDAGTCNVNQQSCAPDQKDSDGSLEDKVEKAKLLIEQQRLQKQKEAEQKERLKEIERRKMGQSVQHLKQLQKDQELKQLVENNEKEKRENQAARERVLAQIAQDKADRAARFAPTPTSIHSPPADEAVSIPNSLASRAPNSTRIQFRFPNGSCKLNDFNSSDKFSTVDEFLSGVNLPFRDYALSTTFPRHIFDGPDRSRTFTELQLVPTAVILVLPNNQNSSAVNSQYSFSALFWLLFNPFYKLWTYVVGFVFGGSPDQAQSGPSVQNDAAGMSTASMPRDSLRQRKIGGESTVVRKHGNVHGLSNTTDTDDENNTWNGNSTQQM